MRLKKYPQAEKNEDGNFKEKKKQKKKSKDGGRAWDL
jgi:hypothetical protein